MTDYISREAALAECDWYANEFCECEYAIMPLKGALENLPAADVRPVVHGRWKNIIQGIIPSGQCSNCGAWDKVTRFCPNCGADMGEGS